MRFLYLSRSCTWWYNSIYIYMCVFIYIHVYVNVGFTNPEFILWLFCVCGCVCVCTLSSWSLYVALAFEEKHFIAAKFIYVLLIIIYLLIFSIGNFEFRGWFKIDWKGFFSFFVGDGGFKFLFLDFNGLLFYWGYFFDMEIWGERVDRNSRRFSCEVCGRSHILRITYHVQLYTPGLLMISEMRFDKKNLEIFFIFFINWKVMVERFKKLKVEIFWHEIKKKNWFS